MSGGLAPLFGSRARGRAGQALRVAYRLRMSH
jgi:hypothetical protein